MKFPSRASSSGNFRRSRGRGAAWPAGARRPRRGLVVRCALRTSCQKPRGARSGLARCKPKCQMSRLDPGGQIAPTLRNRGQPHLNATSGPARSRFPIPLRSILLFRRGASSFPASKSASTRAAHPPCPKVRTFSTERSSSRSVGIAACFSHPSPADGAKSCDRHQLGAGARGV